jgi:hypothetical protein
MVARQPGCFRLAGLTASFMPAVDQIKNNFNIPGRMNTDEGDQRRPQ